MTIITRLTRKSWPAPATDLRAIEGEALLPLDDHPDLKLSSSGVQDLLPAVIARCETRRDVQAAVRTARVHGLVVTAPSRDHDCVQRALTPGELVIDLSSMRDVAIDPATRVAIIAGGATVDDVITASAAHGLVAVTGIHGSTRMADLLMGGGYGPLLGRYGLAADNVLEAEIVLKGGQHVVANADRNCDLLRALRSGRTDFGVVTSLRVRLYALPSLLAGIIFYAWSDADLVLRGYSEMAASAPECLTISVGIVSQSNGSPLLFIAPAWCGELEQGARVLAALQSFGNPLAANVGAMNYADLLAMHDRYLGRGANYSIRRRCLPKLTDRAISAMVVAANARTSPLSTILLHYFHGSVGRMNVEAPTFGALQQHFLAEAIASWEPAADDNEAGHRLWAQNLSDGLAPVGPSNGYPILLPPSDHE